MNYARYRYRLCEDGKPNGNSKKVGKSKGMSCSASRIPKKQRVEKHCNLCQKHGGVQDTHNTNECTKYEKDGTLKSEWAKKSSTKSPWQELQVGW